MPGGRLTTVYARTGGESLRDSETSRSWMHGVRLPQGVDQHVREPERPITIPSRFQARTEVAKPTGQSCDGAREITSIALAIFPRFISVAHPDHLQRQ